MEEMSTDKLNQYLGDLMDWSVVFLPKLFLASAILMAGLWLVKRVSQVIKAVIVRANVSVEVTSFLGSIVDIVLKLLVVLVAASIIGFEVSSLLGLIAAVGFAIGMALQGFLGNFASGITIVFLKPYKVGDWIEIEGKLGRVNAIEIFNTTIITPNHKTLIIPNGKLISDTIINYSTIGQIRLEIKVAVPYEEDYIVVEQIIRNTLQDIPSIMKDPEPLIGIEAFGIYNIIVVVRPYIAIDNYWDVNSYAIYAAIKKAFTTHEIAYPIKHKLTV